MRRTRRSPAPRGFTLMETITAVVILTVAVPPMLWALRESRRQSINPILFSKAAWLAMEKMETVIADRHSATRGFDYMDGANYPAEIPGTATEISGFPQFTRTVEFGVPPGSNGQTQADLVTAGGGYMLVTVSVGWDDAGGDARELEIVAVVTEYDPI